MKGRGGSGRVVMPQGRVVMPQGRQVTVGSSNGLATGKGPMSGNMPLASRFAMLDRNRKDTQQTQKQARQQQLAKKRGLPAPKQVCTLCRTHTQLWYASTAPT